MLVNYARMHKITKVPLSSSSSITFLLILQKFYLQNLYLLGIEEIRVATPHGRLSFPRHLLNCITSP